MKIPHSLKNERYIMNGETKKYISHKEFINIMRLRKENGIETFERISIT